MDLWQLSLPMVAMLFLLRLHLRILMRLLVRQAMDIQGMVKVFLHHLHLLRLIRTALSRTGVLMLKFVSMAGRSRTMSMTTVSRHSATATRSVG